MVRTRRGKDRTSIDRNASCHADDVANDIRFGIRRDRSCFVYDGSDYLLLSVRRVAERSILVLTRDAGNDKADASGIMTGGLSDI